MNDPVSKRPALVHFSFYITRKTLLWAFIGIVLCASVYQVVSETFTMTAFYPSPYGIYSKLISTQDSYFARDSGKVGIGTARPQSLLDVAGGIRFGDSNSPCDSNHRGEMRLTKAGSIDQLLMCMQGTGGYNWGLVMQSQ